MLKHTNLSEGATSRSALQLNIESEAEPPEVEVEGTEICRPQLFFRPDVVGLTEPITVLANGSPTGRWLLCLQWFDGKREMLTLPEWIDRNGGGRLWFAPTPAPLLAGAVPQWTSKGRKRWMEGETPSISSLFQDLCAQIERFIVSPDDDAQGRLATLALWTMLTYCYPAWPAVPYLRIAGTQESGKSRLLEVLSRLTWRPILASSMTAGVLFRTLNERGGTLLLDEAERLQDQTASSELRTVLLAGYKADGRVARLKNEGGSFHTIHFNVFGPKALGGIGELPPALASRCIRLDMLRSPRDCVQARARLDADPGRWRELRDDLYASTLSHGNKIVQVAHDLGDSTEGMSGRDAELWRPLLDLRGLCDRGGVHGLVERVRRFADLVIAENQDDTAPEPDRTLLAILAECVASRQVDVTPKDLLRRAQIVDPVTFARWTPHRAASALRRYGLTTHKTNGGRRSYHRITAEQIRRVARLYGLCIPLANAPFATNATCGQPDLATG